MTLGVKDFVTKVLSLSLYTEKHNSKEGGVKNCGRSYTDDPLPLFCRAKSIFFHASLLASNFVRFSHSLFLSLSLPLYHSPSLSSFFLNSFEEHKAIVAAAGPFLLL